MIYSKSTILILEKIILYITIIILAFYILSMPGSINMGNETLRQLLMTKWAIQYLIIVLLSVISIIIIIERLRKVSKFKRIVSLSISVIAIPIFICWILGNINLY